VATNAEILTEPILFYLASGQRQDRYPVERSQPLSHAAGLREVTRVELVSPDANNPSLELQGIVDANLIELSWGSEYLLKLGFDREAQGQQVDFRPILPLTFSW